jgi:hypothetical protein
MAYSAGSLLQVFQQLTILFSSYPDRWVAALPSSFARQPCPAALPAAGMHAVFHTFNRLAVKFKLSP